MNYYAFIPGIAVIFNVAITTYVLAQRRTPVNRDYILLSSFFIGWIFFDAIHWNPINDDWVVPLLRFQSAFWIPVGFLLTKFTYTLLGKKKGATYYTIMAMAITTAALGVSTDLIVRDFAREYWGVLIVGGPLYVTTTILVTTVPFVYALTLIFLAMKKTRERNVRRQMAMIVTGSSLAAVASLSTLVILPEFFDIRPVPLHHVGIIIHLGFILYAILKYRFMAIGIHDVANDLFSNVRDGVVVLNRQGDVLQANDAAHRLFNETSDKKIIRKVDQLIKDKQLSQRGEIDDHEISIEKNNDRIHLRISRYPVKQAEEEIGTIIFFHDVTRHKKAAEKIQLINRDLAKARDHALEASQTKSRFLANISHELRTPLNAIIGYSELLIDDEEINTNENNIRDLKKIQSSGRHLLELISQVLDLSKVEAGKMDIYIEDIDIPELMDTVVDILQPLVEKNHNQLLVSYPKDIGAINTDYTKLRQILFNLLSNATKFTRDGTIKLEIRAFEEDNMEWLEFLVSDTGIGIEPRYINNLFDPFSQADPSTTRKFGGTGLGLNITHHFCELLGGNISVRSQPNKGTTFIVNLPRQTPSISG
ncbi:ATP-binding protein [Kaarinaea lacus]